MNFSDPFGLCSPWPACALAAGRAGAATGTIVGGVIGTVVGVPGPGTLAGAGLGRTLGKIGAFTAATAGAIWIALRAAEGDHTEGTGRTADEIISAEKKGSIRREFPGEMLGKSQAEIDALAKGGSRTAQKARKLLTDSRFDKDKE